MGKKPHVASSMHRRFPLPPFGIFSCVVGGELHRLSFAKFERTHADNPELPRTNTRTNEENSSIWCDTLDILPPIRNRCHQLLLNNDWRKRKKNEFFFSPFEKVNPRKILNASLPSRNAKKKIPNGNATSRAKPSIQPSIIKYRYLNF